MTEETTQTPLEHAIEHMTRRVATLARLQADEKSMRDYLRTRGVLRANGFHPRVVKIRDARKEAEEGLVYFVLGLKARGTIEDGQLGRIDAVYAEVQDDLQLDREESMTPAQRKVIDAREGRARRALINAVKAEMRGRSK